MHDAPRLSTRKDDPVVLPGRKPRCEDILVICSANDEKLQGAAVHSWLRCFKRIDKQIVGLFWYKPADSDRKLPGLESELRKYGLRILLLGRKNHAVGNVHNAVCLARKARP